MKEKPSWWDARFEHATSPQQHKPTSNPIRNWPATTLIALLVILSTLTGILVCLSGPTESPTSPLLTEGAAYLSPAKPYALPCLITLLFFGLLGFSTAKSQGEFPVLTIFFIIVNLPLLIVMHDRTPSLYLLAILAFTISVLLFSINNLIPSESLGAAIQLTFISWSSLTVFLKTSAYLGFYSESPESLKFLWWIANSRTVLGLASLGFAVIGAFRGMSKDEIPSVPNLPPVRIWQPHAKGSPSLLATLMPFVIAARLILTVLASLIEIAWKLLAYIAIFGFFFTLNFVRVVFAALGKLQVWIRFARCVGAYLLVIFFAYRLDGISSHAAIYLALPSEQFGLSQQVTIFMPLVADFLLLLIVASFIGLLLLGWTAWPDIRERAPFGATTILVVFFISGIVLYLIHRIHLLRLQGFEKFGLFFAGAGILLIALLIGQAIIWVTSREDAQA